MTSDSLTDREYRALAEFRHALRVFLRFSEEAARAEGLSPAQHQLLLAIRGHHNPTGVSITDIADALQLRNNSVVGLVDRVDAAGLTSSRPDPADARRRIVSLTPSGEGALSRLSRLHRDELRTFREEMSQLLHHLG